MANINFQGLPDKIVKTVGTAGVAGAGGAIASGTISGIGTAITGFVAAAAPVAVGAAVVIGGIALIKHLSKKK